jgi:hypothetical protein
MEDLLIAQLVKAATVVHDSIVYKMVHGPEPSLCFIHELVDISARSEISWHRMRLTARALDDLYGLKQ